MDASKFLVDFFKGLSPEIKLDLFNASIELLRASITPQPEIAKPGGCVIVTPNTQRDFVLNTETIKEAMDKHTITTREMENYLSVTTPHVELPETVHYEPEPLARQQHWRVNTEFINDVYNKNDVLDKSMYNMGLILTFSQDTDSVKRIFYLKSETFIRRYLRRRGQGKYIPAGNNFTIAYNHNSRRYGVFPASPASQNTLPWLYAQNRDILQHLINNHTHHLDTIFEVTRDGDGDTSSLSPDRTEPQPPNTTATGGTVTYHSL